MTTVLIVPVLLPLSPTHHVVSSPWHSHTCGLCPMAILIVLLAQFMMMCAREREIVFCSLLNVDLHSLTHTHTHSPSLTPCHQLKQCPFPRPLPLSLLHPSPLPTDEQTLNFLLLVIILPHDLLGGPKGGGVGCPHSGVLGGQPHVQLEQKESSTVF